MTRSRLRTLGRAFVPFTPRTHDLRYDRDVGESGLSPVSSAGPPRGRTIRLTGCIPRISPQSLWCVLVSHRRSAVLQHQEPAGPHRELRCPPGTYFSPRSLRSNPSDLEENAVLDHKVRPRTERSPHPRHLPASRGPTPLERAEQQARHAEDAPSGSWTYTPRVSPQPVRRILEVQPARATSRTPTRPLGPPPPHMSGSPRTPPAKCLPRLTRQPPFPFPGIPEPAAPHP